MSKRRIRLGDEKGTALVIALLVMVTATIVAITANFTSTTEITISGNQRQFCTDFFRADGGLELIKSYFLDNFIFPTDVGDETRVEDVADTTPFDSLGIDTHETKVKKVLEGNPPRGRGISAQYFRGNYYRATSVAPSSIDLEEEFCVISPR